MKIAWARVALKRARPCFVVCGAATLRTQMRGSSGSESGGSFDCVPRNGLRGFWALIAVQFQNAFSDNALKWLISFLVLETARSKQQRDLWFILVVPLLFAVPFLLFSIPGGYFADKYSKRSVTLATKFFELIVMSLATIALARN